MDHTPYANLTDEEFERHLTLKEVPTAEEVEAALRIENLRLEVEALREELGTYHTPKPCTKYVGEAA